MPTLWNAIFWNLAGAPVRLALGVTLTATIARSLYGGDGALLGAFALLNSGIATALLLTSVGIPQMFSKAVGEWLARGEYASLSAFAFATALSRIVAWIVIAAVAAGIFVLESGLIPATLHPILSNPSLVALSFLWGLSYDLSGLTGRLLSAKFEQKWQNVVHALSQVSAIATVATGLLYPSHRLLLAVAGMALMYVVRLAGHTTVLAWQVEWNRKIDLPRGFNLWRMEMRGLGFASLGKFTSYFYSAPFVLLLAGYFLPMNAVASLFLVLDLAGKLLAALMIPVNGLVLPAFARARVGGADQLKMALRYGLTITRLVSLFVGLGVGALVIPFGVLLYWQPFHLDPMLVCLIVGVVIVESLLLELLSGALTVENRLARLWMVKFADITTAFLLAAAALLIGSSGYLALGVLFVARLLLVVMITRTCDVEASQMKLAMPVLGVILGSVVSQIYYTKADVIDFGSVVMATSISAGLALCAVVTLHRSDIRFIVKDVFRRQHLPLDSKSATTLSGYADD